MKYKGERREVVLFIGGPWDGRREEVDAAMPVHLVEEVPEITVAAWTPELAASATYQVKRHAYYFRQFRWNKAAPVTLALHTSVVIDSPLDLLMAGYRRP